MKQLWVDISNDYRIDYIIDLNELDENAEQYMEHSLTIKPGWMKSAFSNRALNNYFCNEGMNYYIVLAAEWED